MAEYAAMFAVSGLAAILFLGGWNGPVPIATWLGLDARARHRARLDRQSAWACAISSSRPCLGVTFMIWLRWTLPRLRIDQVMTTCLKYCVPLASAMLAGRDAVDVLRLPGGVIASSHAVWRAISSVARSCSRNADARAS